MEERESFIRTRGYQNDDDDDLLWLSITLFSIRACLTIDHHHDRVPSVSSTMPAATSAANKQQKEKKVIALKYADGHPLTRQDLQYDLLHHIFADPHRVFTDPYPTNPGQTPQPKLTFRDLYLNTILHSPKCSRGPRDKALENQEFGTEFAKMSLLTNVGRINTTMACQCPVAQIAKHALLTHPLSTVFPELRTQLRTYHPVPPLQKTDGNLQDAPRIKNILKDCFLPSEGKGVPSPSPTEILTRLVCPPQQIRPSSAQTCRSLAAHASLQNQSQSPPTTVVNLLFAITSPSYSPVRLFARDSSDRPH